MATQKKNTKDKYKSNLDDINANHKLHLEELSKNKKKVEDNYSKEIETAEALKISGSNKLNKAIELLEKEYAKKVENVLKEYESNVAKSKKEQEQILKKATSEKEDLSVKLKEAKEKHQAKVASLNEKKLEKVDKLTEATNKKIEKVKADIVKEEERIAKAIEELKPVYLGRLADIEAKIAEEKDHFDTKYGAIKSTLDSKVARHEKFMNKNIKDNDQRATKQHKKEIAILEKNADRELKILTGEHNDKFKVVDTKKRVLVQENLEAIAALSKSLIQFREEKTYQINSYQVILNSDVEVLRLNTESKIQDEINKFNEIERDNSIKLAGVVLKQEIDFEQELDIQAKLEIAFVKDNSFNKVKQDEALAIKAKELNVVEETEKLTAKLAELNKSIELAKLDNETKIAEKELVLDIKVNEENEIIEYHNLDFVAQGQMSNENLLFQTEVKSLFEAREDSVLAYEELEATNRAKLKIEFLEDQKEKILKDKVSFVAKINATFESEQVLYDEEREKASSKDLEELRIYELEANEAITKITDKRNALDPKAYKKEIKDLDLEINNARNDLNSYVKTKRDNITSNTVLFNKGISEATDRRDLSMEQCEEFFNQEVARVDKAINLVNQNKNEEVNDAKDRHLKTFESTSKLLENEELRNNKLVEETTTFKMSRIQNENDVIKDFKDIFEKQKFGFNESLDEAISEFDSEIKSEVSRNKENISKEESNLEQKVAAFNKNIQEIEDNEMIKLDKQASLHKENYSKIEQKESNKVQMAKDEFAKKEATYRSNISEIDKGSSIEAKHFEATKKSVKRDYELKLAKNVSELNLKLQQDIKAM